MEGGGRWEREEEEEEVEGGGRWEREEKEVAGGGRRERRGVGGKTGGGRWGREQWKKGSRERGARREGPVGEGRSTITATSKPCPLQSRVTCSLVLCVP